MLIIIMLIVLATTMLFGLTAKQLVTHNPYTYLQNVLQSVHNSTLFYGVSLEIYDDDTSHNVHRLIITKPDNLIIYNLNSDVFIYLGTPVGTICNVNELPILTINRDSINKILEGNFNISCTNTDALELINYFTVSSTSIVKTNLPNMATKFTIMDIVNYCIYNGIVNLNPNPNSLCNLL